MPPYRIFTIHFQYYDEIPPRTFHLPVDQHPIVTGDKVLNFCDMDGTYYEYNWDQIAHTTLYAGDRVTIEVDKP